MESRTDQQRGVPAEGDGRARAEVPADAATSVRCILVLAETPGAAPADLLKALSARGIEVREHVGVFAGFSELIRCAWDRSRAVALIIIEPDRFRPGRALELANAAARYAPRAAIWRYQRDASPKLTRWSDQRDAEETPDAPASDGSPSRVNGIREAIRAAQGQPALRLTGGDDAPPPDNVPEEPEHDAPARSDRPSSALTDAELAMLLGDDPDDGAGSGDQDSPPRGEQSGVARPYED